jgi:hypothetical protein
MPELAHDPMPVVVAAGATVAIILIPFQKGKSPMVSPESAPGDRRLTLNIVLVHRSPWEDNCTVPLARGQSIGGSLLKCKNDLETSSDHPLFNVPKDKGRRLGSATGGGRAVPWSVTILPNHHLVRPH